MEKQMMVIVAGLLLAAPAFAASTATVSTSADIGTVLDLSAEVWQGDPFTGTKKTAMDFGTLKNSITNDPHSPLAADKHFTVVLSTNSSSRAYRVTQTAAELTNAGGKKLPKGATVMKSWPKNVNNVAYPTGAVVNTNYRSLVGTDVEIYKSESAGAGQAIPVTYAITGDPNAGATEFISAQAPGGSYKTNVTYTITLV